MIKTKYCHASPVTNHPQILLVEINRPSLRNALHPPASHELAAVFRDFQQNNSYRAAILTGTGGEAFCAGNDVKFSASASLQEMQLPAEGFGGLTSNFERTKPIIAAVNGCAFGGGFEIALAADLIVAAQRATFALPEPKIGLAALGGGIHRLSRQIPYKQAMEMLLTGKIVSAEQGEKMGFVNQVVPNEELLEKSIQLAEQIVQCSPLSIEVTMTALQNGERSQSLADTGKSDYQLAKRIFTSEDFKEGVQAFTEKRKPKWTGK